MQTCQDPERFHFENWEVSLKDTGSSGSHPEDFLSANLISYSEEFEIISRMNYKNYLHSQDDMI
jgi:hypothetical protein